MACRETGFQSVEPQKTGAGADLKRVRVDQKVMLITRCKVLDLSLEAWLRGKPVTVLWAGPLAIINKQKRNRQMKRPDSGGTSVCLQT